MRPSNSELRPGHSSWAMLAQKLASGLAAKQENLRTVQYLNVLSTCVLSSAATGGKGGDEGSISVAIDSLLNTIEATRTIELLCAREARFEFQFNHLGLALWHVQYSQGYLLERAELLVEHLNRMLTQPELFNNVGMQLAECWQCSTGRKLTKKTMRMLDSLVAHGTGKRMGEVVQWGNKVGLVLFLSGGDVNNGSRASNGKSESEIQDSQALGEEDDDDEEDNQDTTSGREFAVYFVEDGTTQDVDVDKLVWVTDENVLQQARRDVLVQLGLRSESELARKLAAWLLALGKPSKSTVDLLFDFYSNSDKPQLDQACIELATMAGNLTLAHELMARRIALSGEWPQPQVCKALGIDTKLPILDLPTSFKVSSDAFFSPPNDWKDTELRKWTFCSKTRPSKSGQFHQKNPNGVVIKGGSGTEALNWDEMRLGFLDKPASSVKGLHASNINALFALGKASIKCILFGTRAVGDSWEPMSDRTSRWLI
ncbi:hypothetical protein BASA81_008740 [Batrachochytrium salamandrivorans]|nr:hypothetical protein BASA81_008740 [Batrachochytrium salamandrivorans]